MNGHGAGPHSPGQRGKDPAADAVDLLGLLDSQRLTKREEVVAALGGASSTVGLLPGFRLALAGLVLPLVWWSTVLLREDMRATIGRARIGPDPLMMMLLLVPVAMISTAGIIRNTANRARITYGGALAGALLLAGSALGPAQLSELLLMAAAAAAAAASVVHLPLLFDLYDTRQRGQAVAGYALAYLAAPLVVIASIEATSTLDLTWRVVLLGLALLAAIAGLLGIKLEDPGVGAFETESFAQALPDLVRSGESRPSVPLGEVLSQIFSSRTTRPMLEATAVVGIVISMLAVSLPAFLDEAWQVPRGGRFLAITVTALVAGALTVATAVLAARWRVTGSRVMHVARGFVNAGALALVAGALVTVYSVAIAELVIGLALGLALLPLLWQGFMTALPPTHRAHGAALSGSALFLGIMQGNFIMSAIGVRFGSSFGMAVAGLLLLIGGAALHRGAQTLDADIDAVIDAAVEDHTVELFRSTNPLPLLVCRNIDFSYGPLQVLFGVNLTVDEGEMVALLGTNGAGKSTLLRAISGLAIPQRGSIRLQGDDITFLGAERRVSEGIVQIPGGRGVFGPLSVVENLRLHGYVLGRDRASVDSGLDAVFDAFPRLGERRNQLASTLSGGEQQMLALGKALILRPRILLIDELSLGLAPIVVGELLEMVRSINAAGTAVVLVEQSVNIALTLAHHAYFMEKGEMRFDGRASDLLARGDLLRSVFLGGAAGSLEKSVGPT